MKLNIPYQAIAHVIDSSMGEPASPYTIEEEFDSMQAAVSWGHSLTKEAEAEQGVEIAQIEFNPID